MAIVLQVPGVVVRAARLVAVPVRPVPRLRPRLLCPVPVAVAGVPGRQLLVAPVLVVTAVFMVAVAGVAVPAITVLLPVLVVLVPMAS